MKSEGDVELSGPADLPTPLGEFQVYGFRHARLGGEHAIVTKGELGADAETDVLCRVHSACLTGDVLHSLRCDCGAQLDAALAAIEAEGRGVVIYLNQEGRGIGLFNKVRAYQLQDEGSDTVEANERLGLPADDRDYEAAADALRTLGVDRVRLLTNNPEKVRSLEAAGVRVEERIPIHAEPNELNRSYLGAKRDRLGHLLPP